MRPLRNIAIRRANRDDLQSLTALATAATRALCAPDYTRKQVESVLRFTLSDNTQLIDDRTYFLVENAGQLVAAGGWSYRAAFGPASTDTHENPREILDPAIFPARLRGFFVHPHYARRGLARTLVALCERAAVNAGYTRLELLTTTTGRHLYLACGFADVEWFTNVYPTGVSAITHRMSKCIKPTIRPISSAKQSAPANWFPVTIN